MEHLIAQLNRDRQSSFKAGYVAHSYSLVNNF